MTTPLNGLLGALVVGILASAVAVWVGKAHRPSLSRVLAVGAFYGGAAGAVLVVLELYALGLLGVPPTRTEPLAVAVAWSTLLLAAWIRLTWIT